MIYPLLLALLDPAIDIPFSRFRGLGLITNWHTLVCNARCSDGFYQQGWEAKQTEFRRGTRFCPKAHRFDHQTSSTNFSEIRIIQQLLLGNRFFLKTFDDPWPLPNTQVQCNLHHRTRLRLPRWNADGAGSLLSKMRLGLPQIRFAHRNMIDDYCSLSSIITKHIQIQCTNS